MILWIVLFVLILAISFLLALQSMRDYQEIPSQSEEYALFLIRKPEGLNDEVLSFLQTNALNKGLVISFERLIKGSESALVMFGPRKISIKLKDSLNLLELEDYTNINLSNISAWEVGISKGGKIFENMPQLLDAEQFWWQLILSSSFKAQIRAVVVSGDSSRRKLLTDSLQNLSPDKLFKLPKASSNAQLLDFYQKRTFGKINKNPSLNSTQILEMLTL